MPPEATDQDVTDDLPDASLESAFSDALRQQPSSDEPSEPVVQSEQVSDTEPVQAPEPVNEGFQNLMDSARQLGLSTDGMSSESELTTAVLERLRQSQPYVQFAQQLMPHQEAVTKLLLDKAGPEPPAPAPVKPESDEWSSQKHLQEKYGGPGWKPEFQKAIKAGLVKRDSETGLWQASPGFELVAAPVLQDMNSAQQHSQEFWQDLATSNPYEKFYGALEEPIMRAVEARVNAILQGRDQETQQTDSITQFRQDNAEWLFSKDPNTGKDVLSEDGELFSKTVEELVDAGVQDTGKILEMASRMIGVKSGRPAVEQQAPAPPVPQAPPVQQAAPKQSFLERAAKASHSAGNIPPSTDDSPSLVSELDLENTFVNAFSSNIRN